METTLFHFRTYCSLPSTEYQPSSPLRNSNEKSSQTPVPYPPSAEGGYLGLVMSTSAYAARAGALCPWVSVLHPGNLPVHSLTATAAQITARDWGYDAQLREYAELTKIKLKLKQQILAAVPSMYLRILSNKDFGFADISPHRFLTHLRTTYSNVEPEELE